MIQGERGLSASKPVADACRKGLTSTGPNSEHNIASLVDQHAQARPNAEAYVFLSQGESLIESLTYQELRRRVVRLAAWLERHTALGDRVLLLSPQEAEFTCAFWACAWSGRVAVPMPPVRMARLAGSLATNAQTAKDATAALLLTTRKLKLAAQDSLSTIPVLGELRWEAIEDLLESPDPETDVPVQPVHASTLAMLQYTSGSTSRPKGVMLTHSNLRENMRLFDIGGGHDEHSKVLSWVPHFHDLGLVYGRLTPVYRGIPAYIMPAASFSQRPSRWVEAISRFRITHTSGPNFAFQAVLGSVTDHGLKQLDLSCWRHTIVAAEPVRMKTLDAFASRFEAAGFNKRALCAAWGLAEASCIVTSAHEGIVSLAVEARPEPRYVHVDAAMLAQGKLRYADHATSSTVSLVSNGRPLEDSVVKIVAPESRRLSAPDTVGEVWVANGCVAAGYWMQPEMSREVFEATIEGTEDPSCYLRTGDLGFVNSGDLFLVGRMKDIIIIRGQNHYPQDIEHTVESAHELVRSTCAAAFSIVQAEEERLVVVAEVERRFREESSEEVLLAVREAVTDSHGLQLASLQLVRVGTISKTTSGKIQRQAMKGRFVDGDLVVKAGFGVVPGQTETATLPQATASAVNPDHPGAATLKIRVVQWIGDWLASNATLSKNEFAPSYSFGKLGLDSLLAVRLSGELALAFDVAPFPESVAFDYPTPEALASHVVERLRPARAAPSSREQDALERVAVVGMAGRFPEAQDLEAFWDKITQGKRVAASMLTDRAALLRRLGVEPGSQNGCYLKDVEQFDAGFFQISPKEAEQMDPQQRLLLETTWHALEDAGVTRSQLGGSNTGVFVGMSSSDYAALCLRPGFDLDGHAGAGLSNSIAANRVSYFLDLRGPSVVVDTACSSSLVAVHQAAASISRGECHTAIVAGVNLMLNPEVTSILQSAGMLSGTGACHAFDEGADGYVRSEGVAAIVLRAESKLAPTDRVRAYLAGSAIGQDGHTFGLTAPNGQAQRSVMREALKNARLQGAAIGYVEAHGTGTPLGDPIEYGALAEVYGQEREQPCPVGSLKANYGHLEACAGIAGLIKAVLCLENGVVPPVAELTRPNRRLEHVPGLVLPNQSSKALKLSYVGVTSMGFGGANAHVILQRANQPQAAQLRPGARVLPISADSQSALRGLVSSYERILSQSPENWPRICVAAALHRSQLSVRSAFVGESAEELLQQLREASARPAKLPTRSAPRIVLCIGRPDVTGAAGYQQLADHVPLFRQALEECNSPVRALVGCTARELIEQARPGIKESGETETNQDWLAHAVVSVACATWLRQAGLQFEFAVGRGPAQSLAKYWAGKLSLEEALGQVFRSDARSPADGDLWELCSIGDAALSNGLNLPKQSLEACLQEAVAAGGRQVLALGKLDDIRSSARQASLPIAPLVGASGLWRSVMDAFAELFRSGVNIDFSAAYEDVPRSIDTLPSYPFHRTPHWLQHGGTQFQEHPSEVANPTSLHSTEVTAHLGGELGSQASSPSEPNDAPSWAGKLKDIVGQLLKMSGNSIEDDVAFLDLGADSLVLTELIQRVQSLTGLEVRLDDLFDGLGTVGTLAAWMDSQISFESTAVTTTTERTTDVDPQLSTAAPVVGAHQKQEEPGGKLESLMQQQLRSFEKIVEAQLAAVGGHRLSVDPPSTLQPSSSHVGSPAEVVARKPADLLGSSGEVELDPRQRAHLVELVQAYTTKTRSSKQYAIQSRRIFADYRNTFGFRQAVKELSYPLVVPRASGSHLTCLDGHDYVDLTMAFGSSLLGHNAKVVTDAISGQLPLGIQVGPRSPLAAEAAQLVSDLTGTERVAFANSGTEAVMTAIRLARAVTGRQVIVRFTGSYHGHSDTVLARRGGSSRGEPMAKGVPPATAAQSLVLEYGSDAALDEIREHAGELAAVVVEPIQSRRPGLQPGRFLAELRRLADDHGFALLFDEIITGFRLEAGGAQTYFDVRADLVTYGKVAGGGMPIGVIAGTSRFMNAIDGGLWSFGDSSRPSGPTTFFAGTFCGHPLTMAATIAVLKDIKKRQDTLYPRLNGRAESMVERLNRAFESEQMPIFVDRAGSMFRFVFMNNYSVEYQPIEANLFFSHMALRGVYIWEGHTCFLSEAHSDTDIDTIVNAALESARALQMGGFLTPKAASRRRTTVAPRSRASDENLLAALNEAALAGMEFGFAALNARDVSAPPPVITRSMSRLKQRVAAHLQGRPAVEGADLDVLQGRFESSLADYEKISESTALRDLLRRCALALPDVVQGKRGGAQTLFEQGAEQVEAVYTEAPGMVEQHETLKSRVRELVQKLKDEQRPIRVLEVGAGTGATTRHVLEALTGAPYHYVFSDISPLFVSRAQRTFEPAHSSRIEFLCFDLASEEPQAALPFEHFDLIVAANVVHALPDITLAVQRLANKLSADGCLLLIECVKQHPWLDLIFGLADGWWAYQDTGLRSSGPLLGEKGWTALLEELDLGDVDVRTFGDTVALVAAQAADDAVLFTVPLSVTQRDILVHQELGQSAARAYHETVLLETASEVDESRLKEAVDAVVRRHDSLRSVVSQDHKNLLVKRNINVPIETLKLGALPEAIAKKKAREWLRHSTLSPSELETGPLLRVLLAELPDGRAWIALLAHHLIIDGLSFGALVEDLRTHYDGVQALSPSTTLSLEEANRRQSNYSDTARQFWCDRLSPPVEPLDLPVDRPYPEIQDFAADRVVAEVPEELRTALQDFCRVQRTTPSIALLAAWQLLLQKVCGQRASTVGVPVSVHGSEANEQYVGFGVNVLPIRTESDPAATFAEWTLAVKAEFLQCLHHRSFPFPEMVRTTNPTRDLSRPSLVSVLFNYEAIPRFGGTLGLQALVPPVSHSKYELVLDVIARDDRLSAVLTYCTGLFDHNSGRLLVDRYLTLLSKLLLEPTRPLGEYHTLLPEESACVSGAKLATAADTDGLVARFEAQAQNSPNSVALRFDQTALTYRELDERANALAAHLLEKGARQGGSIAVCLPRTPLLVVTLLAVLKTGAAYAPIDPAYPSSRKQGLLRAAQADLAITVGETALGVEGLKELDLSGGLGLERRVERVARRVAHHVDQVAYLIFTSGSTGTPKGVAISHRNALALLDWAADEYAPGDIAGVLASTSVSFDLSIFELFVPLCSGGKVVLVENALALTQQGDFEDVSLVNTVPSAMHAVLRAGDLPPALRVVNLAGEALSAGLVAEIYRRSPSLRVYNLYGPSEDTTYSTFVRCHAGDEKITIGRPGAGRHLYILDADGQPVPVGSKGVIHMSGAGVALGYQHESAQTAACFLPNQFAAVGGSRLYRTGDYGRLNAAGEVEYLGRRDGQVKVRGHRIELSEVDAAMAGTRGVRDAVTVASTDARGQCLLMVAWVPTTSAAGVEARLREVIRKTLPGYMMPSCFAEFEQLPLTPNGKVDRTRLSTMLLERERSVSTASQPPSTEAEKALAQLWCELLGVPSVGTNDDFFELGGHSLLATELVTQVQKRFGQSLKLTDVLRRPTIEKLAETWAQHPSTRATSLSQGGG